MTLLSAPRAFMARDYFCCETCGYQSWNGLMPWCRRNGRSIRWPLYGFGCGDYCSGEREDYTMNRERVE